mmetsp:Transcript_20309/g.56431  ORF Transcript_20309/g.56431 Transcript_20309/m.56431 type:complete len:111 (+) Transcript_20309:99-431(+)
MGLRSHASADVFHVRKWHSDGRLRSVASSLRNAGHATPGFAGKPGTAAAGVLEARGLNLVDGIRDNDAKEEFGNAPAAASSGPSRPQSRRGANDLDDVRVELQDAADRGR